MNFSDYFAHINTGQWQTCRTQWIIRVCIKKFGEKVEYKISEGSKKLVKEDGGLFITHQGKSYDSRVNLKNRPSKR